MHPTDIPGGLYTAPRKLTPPCGVPRSPRLGLRPRRGGLRGPSYRPPTPLRRPPIAPKRPLRPPKGKSPPPCRRSPPAKTQPAPDHRAPRCLMVDPILAVPLDRCVARCTGGKGCTWGTRAGGLSRPRQRPPAIISAPLSGLWQEGVARSVARRPSGPKRRGARAVSTRPAIPRANIRRKQARSSPDRGASNLAGGRWRGCDKPPARVPHGHPAPGARAPRTPLAARTRPHTSIGRHLQRWGQPSVAPRGGGRGEGRRCTIHPPPHATASWTHLP